MQYNGCSYLKKKKKKVDEKIPEENTMLIKQARQLAELKTV
jgi:hypothetical protein